MSYFDAGGARIVLLGEIHDNALHHDNQAAAVRALRPTALVVEMLTPEQVAAAQGIDRRDGEALGLAFGWQDAGWPAFSLYQAIFAAAPEASVYGAAVPRDEVRRAMTEGAAALLPDMGLEPLPEAEQAEREAMQAEAHCGALPEHMLPGMVEAQRYRDASFAATALRALRETGGPVVVITGNGHARADWGVPRMIAAAAPEARVLTIGQFEEAAEPDPPFDLWLVTEAAERGDPCAAFR